MDQLTDIGIAGAVVYIVVVFLKALKEIRAERAVERETKRVECQQHHQQIVAFTKSADEFTRTVGNHMEHVEQAREKQNAILEDIADRMKKWEG